MSPNDSAKVRKIFRPANFLHSGSYWDIRDNVNQGPSNFPRMPVSATHRTARETFNLFRILSFRLELRWPSDVNREATIFCATPAKAPGTHAFYKILITNNLQKAPVTGALKFEGT